MKIIEGTGNAMVDDAGILDVGECWLVGNMKVVCLMC
jgi:hypothetical protein